MLARLLCFFSCFWQNKPCFNEKMNHPVGGGAHDDPFSIIKSCFLDLIVLGLSWAPTPTDTRF